MYNNLAHARPFLHGLLWYPDPACNDGSTEVVGGESLLDVHLSLSRG